MSELHQTGPEHKEGSVRREILVYDNNLLEVLQQILTTMKKIEFHLSIATDTELKDQDI